MTRVARLLGVGLWLAAAGLQAQPDAQGTKAELARILERYPPNLRGVLAIDPGLLTSAQYTAAYPELKNFVDSHPEVARNPGFFVDGWGDAQFQVHGRGGARDVLDGLAALSAICIAVWLLTWLIRTLIDYKRWSRLSRVQTEVHTKLLDRMTGNDDLRAYMESAAGSKFLESAPISLDEGPRSVGAPMGRILWSIQAGVVMVAAGMGMQFAADRVGQDGAPALHVLGILGIAVGIGFIASAGVSYAISYRLGLIGK